MSDTHRLHKRPSEFRRRLRLSQSEATLSNDGCDANVVSEVLRLAVLEQVARESSRQMKGCSPAEAGSLHEVEKQVRQTCEEGGAATGAGRDQGSEANTSSAFPGWKRVIDLTLVFMTLALWLPVMILIATGVRLSSAGPIFYRQERVGRAGRRFMIFKFRTMKVNVETRSHESYFEQLMQADTPMTKLDANGDPRLIRWGRFLRAAGLDELPQIFNVLKGEMSLVGPRPCTVHEFNRYLPWQRERVNAPPGLTGYWQVNGKNKTTFSEMITMDIFYGKNMSPGLDLSILARTLPAVLEQVLETRGISWARVSRPKCYSLPPAQSFGNATK